VSAKVCSLLCTPERFNNVNMTIGVSFMPMLASKVELRKVVAGHTASTTLLSLPRRVSQVEAALAGKPFVMDIKLDGERMVVHKDGDDVRFFTRKANEYTKGYGPILGLPRRFLRSSLLPLPPLRSFR
jgi:ATP-dependent DNA ligase